MSKIMTVLGEVDSEELGIVLPHEHLLWDMASSRNKEPKELWQRERMRQAITLENLGHVLYHTYDYIDNLIQTDINVAIEEVMKFKMAGGKTICEQSTRSMGRDPKAFYEIALATGLNIVISSGKFVAKSWDEEEKNMAKEAIRSEIVSEFENGIDGTGIKPGIIKIGVSDINNVIEIKNLEATVLAQKQLDCPVSIHPPLWEKKAKNIIDILKNNGANINKIAIDHCDPTLEDYEYHDYIAKQGAFIEYDHIGMHLMSSKGWFLKQDDNDRIRAIKKQIDMGNLNKILISQDISFKVRLTKWGGFGYSHILDNIVPRLKQEGISDEEINTILIENPKKFLCG